MRRENTVHLTRQSNSIGWQEMSKTSITAANNCHRKRIKTDLQLQHDDISDGLSNPSCNSLDGRNTWMSLQVDHLL